MAEDVKDQEPVTPDEPIDDEAVVKEPGDVGPVPYERFKEVNDALKAGKAELEEYKRLGLSPEVIIERLSRGDMLQRMLDSDEEPEDAKTPDSEEEAAQKERAKKLILELFPKLKNLEDMSNLIELHYEAMEMEAWNTVKDILVEEERESSPDDIKGMGGILADLIKNDNRLRAKYNTGKVEEAVRGAWKKLGKKFGFDKKPEKKSDTRATRIKDKQKLSELPKKIAPGGRPEGSVEPDKGPSNLAEANKSAMKKLEGIFG